MNIKREKVTAQQKADILRGARRLAPGIWLDRHGHAHLSVPELLELVDLEDTPANRETVTEIVSKIIAREYPQAAVVITEDHTH